MRGIYYVGIAINQEDAKPVQTFDALYSETENFCGHGKHGSENSPYWRYLDALTRPLLGGAYHETVDRWGWSNLLKIAGNKGDPGEWPTVMKEQQRGACSIALKEEVDHLKDSLILITSDDEFGILHSFLPAQNYWCKEFNNDARFLWLRDPKTGNLYVHSYHPNFMRRKGFFDIAAARTIELARRELPPL
jgi:hypothetical protein